VLGRELDPGTDEFVPTVDGPSSARSDASAYRRALSRLGELEPKGRGRRHPAPRFHHVRRRAFAAVVATTATFAAVVAVPVVIGVRVSVSETSGVSTVDGVAVSLGVAVPVGEPPTAGSSSHAGATTSTSDAATGLMIRRLKSIVNLLGRPPDRVAYPARSARRVRARFLVEA
jgi:hypothetical protein